MYAHLRVDFAKHVTSILYFLINLTRLWASITHSYSSRLFLSTLAQSIIDTVLKCIIAALVHTQIFAVFWCGFDFLLWVRPLSSLTVFTTASSCTWAEIYITCKPNTCVLSLMSWGTASQSSQLRKFCRQMICSLYLYHKLVITLHHWSCTVLWV